MITHTRAIILKTVDYQESSRIITVLSEQHGRMALIVKGSRKPKSKFSGLIEPGHILDVVYYYKPNRSVQVLTEASLVHSFLNKHSHFEKTALLYSILELTAQMIHEGETNEKLYKLVYNVISWIGDQDEVKLALLPYVQIRSADCIGLSLISDIENVVKDGEYFFNVETGTTSHTSDTNLSFKLSLNQAMFMVQAINSRNMKVFELPIQNPELKTLIRHLDVYFKYHIDGYKERKSDKLIDQFL